MQTKMSRCMGWILTFMGGFVVAMNLMLLLEPTGNYEASWFKVAFAGGLALFGEVTREL